MIRVDYSSEHDWCNTGYNHHICDKCGTSANANYVSGFCPGKQGSEEE